MFHKNDVQLVNRQLYQKKKLENMGQLSSNVNFGEVHGIILSVAWFLFAHLGIWSLHFKHNRYAVLLHIFFMSCAAFLMAMGPIMMIVSYGSPIIVASITHELWGFIQFCILPLVLLSGAICKFSKDSPSISPEKVYFRNKSHSIVGWSYMILIQVPLLTGWYGTNLLTDILFGLIIFVVVLSFPSYLYLKFFGKPIQAESINTNIIKKGSRSIKSLKDLKIYSENYFIFANYVYSISPILGAHPGGWNIIEAVRTREVDRFLYGVDPIEKYDVPRISHSLNSINLAGSPLAVLAIPQTYHLQEINQVKVSHLYCHNKAMTIHTVYFDLGSESRFLGYTDLTQIGQYYSLTVNSQLTRLYTAVNFLQPANLTLIDRISKSSVVVSKNFYPSHSIVMGNQEQNFNAELVDYQKEHNTRNLLPLLIKKYNDGKFTPLFLSPQSKIDSIKISQPRGLGLALDCVTAKNIVVFAGGTGLYPYSDLIDLLFKAKLVREEHQLSSMILESDPILKKRPFEDMHFTFYIAVNELEELHPVTLYQCNQISKSVNVKCYAKFKGANLHIFKQDYSSIQLNNDRFEKLVSKQLIKNSETCFYICGPIRFTKSLVIQLELQGVPPQNYKIV